MKLIIVFVFQALVLIVAALKSNETGQQLEPKGKNMPAIMRPKNVPKEKNTKNEPKHLGPKEKSTKKEPKHLGPKEKNTKNEPKHLGPKDKNTKNEPKHLGPKVKNSKNEPKHLGPKKKNTKKESKHLGPKEKNSKSEPKHLGPKEKNTKNEPKHLGLKEKNTKNGPKHLGPKKKNFKNESKQGMKVKTPKNEPKQLGLKGENLKNEHKLLGPIGKTPKNESKQLGLKGKNPKNELKQLGPKGKTLKNEPKHGLKVKTPNNDPKQLGPKEKNSKNEHKQLGSKGKTPKNESDQLGPKGKKITAIMSPKNEPKLLAIGAKKKKNNFFRSKSAVSLTPEEKIVQSFWKTIEKLPCKEGCGTFHEDYKDSFDQVVKLFASLENSTKVENDLDTFISIFQELLTKILENEKLKVNERLVKAAFLNAMYMRPDSEHVDMAEIFPALKTVNIKKGTGFRAYQHGETPWEKLPKTPSRVKDPESKMDYFREDESLHTFHDTFHRQNFGPSWAPRPRQNEHFFYMHRLFIYRYFTERDTEGLPPITPLNLENRQQEFETFYSITKETDPTDQLHKFSSNKPTCTLSQDTRDRIEEYEQSCDSKLVEAGDSCEKYGDYCMDHHNYGHDLMSYDCKGGDRAGLLLDSAVSARDPIFYRWHYTVDDKYENFLRAQPPYKKSEIVPPEGITLLNVELQSRCKNPNQVETYWEMKDTKYQLNHMPFQFNIRLQNSKNLVKKVMFRVYLVKEKFISDNKYYFELDRFVHSLTGNQEENIVRFDNQSSLIWRNRDECGWPDSLVLPKGPPNRLPEDYRVVVFVSEVTNDAVDEGSTNEPVMLCGPKQGTMDERPNGWPLQRNWEGVSMLDVILNKDGSFGKISTIVQILNRGLNPTICEDASFKSPVVTQTTTVTPVLSYISEPSVTQTTTVAPVLSYIPEPATSTVPTLPETVTLSPIGPSTSELTSVPGGLKFCKDTFCFLLSASPIDTYQGAIEFCKQHNMYVISHWNFYSINFLLPEITKARELMNLNELIMWEHTEMWEDNNIDFRLWCPEIIIAQRGGEIRGDNANCKQSVHHGIYALCDSRHSSDFKQFGRLEKLLMDKMQ
ncbi:uncharacterized protein LOC111695519 isoform X2 [Eurytemora carolleeae]|uniref:uncharacterized protein LOC111695519 isoform X2 n=1 Tax=Eurytemora carolleeae TaxID=1294199 RepID=UPI000C78F1EC|nr:uncharacterized protein LOC111695519 isoform X2 [Eurytemora carolleeae]|eukprot:XP_023320655.1 uncharacterized protein LOC111695519 isoform X2 [Eurytemora affinis]